MTKLLPFEIIRHILGYVKDVDIDLRRTVGMYSRIDMRQFSNLKIGYKVYENISKYMVRITQVNLYDFPERVAKKIDDDYWDITVEDFGSKISFYIVKHQYKPNKYYPGKFEYNVSFYDYDIT
jgi:hypothetical protein